MKRATANATNAANAERLDPKEDAMKDLVRIFLPRFALAILISLGFALSCAQAFGEPQEPPGSDVFATPREALLREKPSPNARVVSKLPQGAHLQLEQARERYLRVEVCGGTPARAGSPGRSSSCSRRRSGHPGMVVVGRSLGGSESNRVLAAVVLLRASERLREGKTGDPEVEVLLGESVGAAGVAGGPVSRRARDRRGSRTGGRAGPVRRLGLRARGADAREGPEPRPWRALRERASAGALRPAIPAGPTPCRRLTQESAAWLMLVETAEDPEVLSSAAERAGAASLALGRCLLALGRTEEVGGCGSACTPREAGRLPLAGTNRGPPPGLPGRRARSDARQRHGRVSAGGRLWPRARAAGSSGSTASSARSSSSSRRSVGATRDVQVQKSAVPILPVPGSLRISPDGRSVAWVEVISPSRLLPVVTSLDRDEPAREIAFLSSGRPLRDRELAHVVSSVSGFSKDGQRLGMVIEAWNETPGPSPRYSVVSVATGELLFETSEDMKSYERLLK